MFLDGLRSIKSDPGPTSERIREAYEPCILIVIGGAGLSCGITGKTERLSRCGSSMFDHPSQGLSGHPCDRRGHYLFLAGVSLINDVAVGIIDPLDQVGLLPLASGGERRIGGCHIF